MMDLPRLVTNIGIGIWFLMIGIASYYNIPYWWGQWLVTPLFGLLTIFAFSEAAKYAEKKED